MNEIRSNGFWIVGCGQAVSSHIFQCVTCRRLRSSTSEQNMANLPEDRTEPSPPFTYCGVDCFGPFYTRDGRKEHKRYGLLNTILHQFAGRLDSASLRTFFYEAMAIVNGRPLTVENLGDPCGPEPLTPNHLLTMKSKVILPPPGNIVKEDVYARKRWRQVQYLSSEFWARWRKECLVNLQVRQKWNNSRRNLKVEDVVLIKDAELARGQWRLGQVVEVYPDKDQLVRKVRLRVGDPTLDKLGRRVAKVTYVERPIQKLVLLLESD